MNSINQYPTPDQTYEGLPTRGERLARAPGLKFRFELLEQGLVLPPDFGQAVITLDDLGNVYDRVGAPYSNFKP